MGMHAVHLGERDFQFCLVAWAGRKGLVEVQIWNSMLGQRVRGWTKRASLVLETNVKHFPSEPEFP